MQKISEVPVINIKAIDKSLKQEAKAGALIAGELYAGEYCDYDGACHSAGHCAIGRLLFDAGVSNKYMQKHKGEELSSSKRMGKILKNQYGLLPAHVDAIESINDEVVGEDDEPTDFDARYQAVMGLVEFIDTAQSQGLRFDESEDINQAYHESDWSWHNDDDAEVMVDEDEFGF